MTRPNQLFESSGQSVQVVTGGHKGNPAPGKNSGVQCIDPTRHGPGVNEDSLPFNLALLPPTQAQLETFSPPVEPGTLVVCQFTHGESGGRVISAIIGGQETKMGGSAGNNPLYDKMRRAIAQKTGKRRKPNIREVEENGARVLEAVEKSGEWMHQLTRGIAAHAAYPQIAGTILPQIKGIATAVQTFSNIPTAAMLANLPGAALSINNILRNLSSRQRRTIFKNTPVEVLEAAESLFDLMTEVSDSGFITDQRGNKEIFEENILNLLAQSRTISDVLDTLTEAISNTELRGLDTLPSISVSIQTPFGEISAEMNLNGEIEIAAAGLDLIKNAINSISSLLGSAVAGAPGKFLFGEAASLVNDAITRLPKNKRTAMIQRVPRETKTEKQDEIHTQTTTAGRPLGIWV
jgi:hypothetical protein